MNNKWQDEVRNRMNSHEEPAPDDLWEGLERRLISENMFSETDIAADINMSPNKNRRFWAISIGAAAAVILMFFILGIPESNKNNDTLISDNKRSSELKVNVISGNDKSVSPDAAGSSESERRTSSGSVEEKESGSFDNKVSKNQLPQREESGSRDNISKESISRENGSREDISKENVSKENVPEEDIQNNPDLERKRNSQLFASSNVTEVKKQSRWQTNISMSNTPSGSIQTYPGYGTFVSEETVNQEYAFVSQYTREEAYTDVEHEQPVTFGLSLRYNLSDRWSLTSGLTYSILSSKLRSESSNYFYDDSQKLHFIGVPLNVSYILWQNNKIATYVSAGGLVEKNIAGKLTSHYYIDNELEATTHRSITSERLQWSVNSAVGIEYRITDLFGIYAEPGVVHYFNNGSNLETIYKDRPTNFNLRIGLRLNINN